MLSNEELPIKSDNTTATTTTSTTPDETPVVTITSADETSPAPLAAEAATATVDADAAAAESAPTATKTSTLFRQHMQQKGQYVRELLARQRQRHAATAAASAAKRRALAKQLLSKDRAELLGVILACCVALAFSASALLTNSWLCGSNGSLGLTTYGLWGTCFLRHAEQLPATVDNSTLPVTSHMSVLACASQSALNGGAIHVDSPASQCRLDMVSASQGLLVAGAILYLCSLAALGAAYNYMQHDAMRLNLARNAMVLSLCAQVSSLLMQLVGFYLYLLTERVATSVALLFVYFGLAVIATNTSNFITVEYKTLKNRQQLAI